MTAEAVFSTLESNRSGGMVLDALDAVLGADLMPDKKLSENFAS